MDNAAIVSLYWERNEAAIRHTQQQYGAYLTRIAYGILENWEDSRECANDTYLRAWQSIPPQRPAVLAAYLGKITRQLAIDLFRKQQSQRRKASRYAVSLEELAECVSQGDTTIQDTDLRLLGKAISDFLRTLPEEPRRSFIQRYYFVCSIEEIARSQKMSVSAVKSQLFRIRKQLKDYLTQEGFEP